MYIVERKTGQRQTIEIVAVDPEDYKKFTKSIFWFDWKEEIVFDVYKLQTVNSNEILALISLETFVQESRIEIRLLAASRENRGQGKKYERLIGNLIAFACKEAIKMFGHLACVSLIPKTILTDYYKNEYGMLEAGRSLFLDGKDLLEIIKRFDDE